MAILLFEIVVSGCGDRSPRQTMSELALMYQILRMERKVWERPSERHQGSHNPQAAVLASERMAPK